MSSIEYVFTDLSQNKKEKKYQKHVFHECIIFLSPYLICIISFLQVISYSSCDVVAFKVIK